jgi:hypothetical protein
MILWAKMALQTFLDSKRLAVEKNNEKSYSLKKQNKKTNIQKYVRI